jgi:SAM-dependent methyltransferase
MNSNIPALHDRYATQALWTEELRERLLDRIKLPSQPRVLEVGSGTGCITSWTSGVLKTPAWGIDIDYPTVQFARRNDHISGYAQADGAALPFSTDNFDLVFCHFLLLWTPDPEQILREMKRCVRPQGWIIAFAEPDYDARIDYPEELAPLGQAQNRELNQSGAHAHRGRQLRELFATINLREVRAGLLGGEWEENPPDDLDSEWRTLRTDLAHAVPAEELDVFERLDHDAWKKQSRILFIPTFYALGTKTP